MNYVYIMASKKRGILYIGVTSNLANRTQAHKDNVLGGFTSKYHIHKLVYYEAIEDITSAIQREKHIKKWNREWKINLIEKTNPEWLDLSQQEVVN
jgi:putative endonuclease